jgi:putative ABC transport system substrate-binding protein
VIDRRTFIGMLAGGLVTSFTAPAQQPNKFYRIGILGNTESPSWESFRRGLQELGYVDGRNVTMEWRWAKGRTDQFPSFVAELIQMKVDIIIVSSTQAALAAKQGTSTIPILIAATAYPDKVGLVDSLARPGGNITGFTSAGPQLMGKCLQVLKEFAPKTSRVAVLWNPANPVEPLGFAEVLAAAPGAGVAIESIEARTPDDHAAGFATVTASRADALFAFSNPVNFKNKELIADFALKNRLPSLFQERSFVVAGGLASYAPSYVDLFGRAATYVDKILKGAKPADLPVQQPTSFVLVINERTARTLGLTIPKSMQEFGYERV